jgi:hypothetical protein
VPENEQKPGTIEEKLSKMSEEGIVILAKRKKTCVKLPKIREKLNWESVYSEIRADRMPQADRMPETDRI